MFYCKACQLKNNWPDSWSGSYGKCEVCGKPSLCYDVHHSRLPDAVKPLKSANRDFDEPQAGI